MATSEGIGTAHQYESCPYNKAHQILRYKMHMHIAKCRLQHPDSKTRACPFDARHVINEPELDHHVRNCPARHMLDTAKYDVDPSVNHVPPTMPVPDVQAEENWDDDNFQAYNPREATNNTSHLIRKLPGQTPSARRAFRMEQRNRFNSDRNAEHS